MPRPRPHAALACLSAVLSGCASSSLTTGSTSSPHPAADPAWSSLFSRTDGWTGADGAATIPLPNHRTLWLFGDSWIGPIRDHRHAAGSTMVNNTIAIQDVSRAIDVSALRDFDAPPPLTFFWNSSDPAHPPPGPHRRSQTNGSGPPAAE